MTPGHVRFVVATTNAGKLHEIEQILAERVPLLQGLPEFPSVRFPAEGGDYRRNAIAKAAAAAEQLGECALADDSGLEVVGLSGGPGAYSARYGGPDLDDEGRVRHLLAELAARPGASRRARFVCWAAAARPDGLVASAFGECAGTILEAPRGQGGFGYDPVFMPDGFEASMAQLPARTKNEISHRARAFRELFEAGEWPGS